ncbi:MAG: hypothetical protein NC039_01385 [Muribaculaceae bacterium]|nr:hypothetical protein [Muribaculaceae bacterium]
MTCNESNAHPRDAHLEFDPDEHRYTYHGREFKSVTTLIEDYFPKFDAEKWSVKIALREGVDPQVVRSRWEAEGRRARELGTAMHEKIDQYYLGSDCGDDADSFRLFRRFAANTTLIPYRTEWRIYHEEYDIAGTLDFLELTPGGTFNLWDWKRSSKLVDREYNICSNNRFGTMGFHPISNIPDTPYWHYALQLSVYRFILEEKYGIRVSKAMLGVFHPDYDRAWVIPMPDMPDHVAAILRHRISSPCVEKVL